MAAAGPLLACRLCICISSGATYYLWYPHALTLVVAAAVAERFGLVPPLRRFIKPTQMFTVRHGCSVSSKALVTPVTVRRFDVFIRPGCCVWHQQHDEWVFDRLEHLLVVAFSNISVIKKRSRENPVYCPSGPYQNTERAVHVL